MSDPQLIQLTADIVVAHVSHNKIAAVDVSRLIESVYSALLKTGEPPVIKSPDPKPAVPVRASIKHDYLICLEDGAKLKMLKRYLRTKFRMTPEEYRAKWNLPRDYPMVASAYAEMRSKLAKSRGLGRKTSADGLITRNRRKDHAGVQSDLQTGGLID